MDPKEQFDFLNSPLWIETTQAKYEDLDHIKHLISNYGFKRTDWNQGLKIKIEALRKVNSFPLFLECLDKKFWFFMTDEISERLSFIEKKGEELFSRISEKAIVKKSFSIDAQIEEAITSAIYEGANTTRSEAKKFMSSDKNPASVAEHMVLNNFEANKWIQDNKSLPLSKELILRVHQIVTQNTLSEEDAPFCGKFRNGKVVVGNASIHEGVNFKKINESLDEAIDLVNNNKRFLHPILKGIILHYLIAYIHPFFDGNGRTARTLFYFKCLKHDLDWVNALSISAALKGTGKGYEKSFLQVKSNEWDLTYFIIYCLKSLEKAVKVVEGKVDKLCRIPLIQDQYDFSDAQVQLIQRLYLHKNRSYTVKEYASTIQKSDETARTELKELEATGFLISFKVKNKSSFFVNKEYLDEYLDHID